MDDRDARIAALERELARVSGYYNDLRDDLGAATATAARQDARIAELEAERARALARDEEMERHIVALEDRARKDASVAEEGAYSFAHQAHDLRERVSALEAKRAADEADAVALEDTKALADLRERCSKLEGDAAALRAWYEDRFEGCAAAEAVDMLRAQVGRLEKERIEALATAGENLLRRFERHLTEEHDDLDDEVNDHSAELKAQAKRIEALENRPHPATWAMAGSIDRAPMSAMPYELAYHVR